MNGKNEGSGGRKVIVGAVRIGNQLLLRVRR